jgi:hypothetical protein
VSFLPIPVALPVPDRGRMTTTLDGLLTRIQEFLRGQEILWAAMERIDPDPTPYLHWEPTTSGWRLYGRLVPPL